MVSRWFVLASLKPWNLWCEFRQCEGLNRAKRGGIPIGVPTLEVPVRVFLFEVVPTEAADRTSMLELVR